MVPELGQQSLGQSPTHVPPAIHYLWGAQRSRYTIGALKTTALVLAGCIPNLLSEAGTCNIGEQQAPSLPWDLTSDFGARIQVPETIRQKRGTSPKHHLCTRNIILNIFKLEQTKVLCRRHVT